MSITLSESHNRGISVTLSLLDKALYEFAYWAEGHQVRSVLYEIQNELSPSQQENILAEIAEMRATLQDLRDELDLENQVRTVKKMILGSCGVLWASLLELEGKRLGRYGDVPPGLTEYLEPRVATLIQKVRKISDIVQDSSRR